MNPDIQAISCAVVEDYKKKSNELEDELSWMEWQANALAPKILIPAKTGKEKLSEILNRLHRAYCGRLRDGYVMELAISEFADFFKVSTIAAKIRAVELGFEQAAGVFNFVDGKNYPPFSFRKGSLKKGQTFVEMPIQRVLLKPASIRRKARMKMYRNVPVKWLPSQRRQSGYLISLQRSLRPSAAPSIIM